MRGLYYLSAMIVQSVSGSLLYLTGRHRASFGYPALACTPPSVPFTPNQRSHPIGLSPNTTPPPPPPPPSRHLQTHTHAHTQPHHHTQPRVRVPQPSAGARFWMTSCYPVESRFGQKRGFGETPGTLLTISKPNHYPKFVNPPGRKGVTKPNL